MSNIRIALYLLLLGAVYAVAAKLDEAAEPAARAAAGPSAAIGRASLEPRRAEAATAAASRPNAACRAAC